MHLFFLNYEKFKWLYGGTILQSIQLRYYTSDFQFQKVSSSICIVVITNIIIIIIN